MATATARDQYIDQGEHIDLVQTLTPGGPVASGQTWNGQLYGQQMAQDNVTATHLGTQATSLLVTGPMIRVTTVASAADSILLPPSVRGMEIVVVNDAAANAMQVFASGTDTINGTAGATGVSVAALNGSGAGPTIFYCFSNGAWRTK
jgi:hypothetical protein